MDAYAIAPLIPTIAYILLFIVTIMNRPIQKKQRLFLIFLFSNMTWSFVAFLFRSNYLPGNASILFKLTVVFFAITAVQFHSFMSFFYPPGMKKWLTFSYLVLIPITALVFMGYVTSDVIIYEPYPHGTYRFGVVLVAALLMVIASRNLYVFSKILKQSDNIVNRNQASVLLIGTTIMMVFTVVSLPSWFNAFPITHYGNLLNAFFLSYAILRHNLIDIKIVVRQGTAWFILSLIGFIAFFSLLAILHSILQFQLDVTGTIVATGVGLFSAFLIYKIRQPLFVLLGRAFQGERYAYRQKLTEFTDKVHNIFSLKEQGGELLQLLTQSIRAQQACLLFKEVGGEDFVVQLTRPTEYENALKNLRIRGGNPIIKYLEKEKIYLTRDKLEVLPEFLGMWPQEKDDIASRDIRLFVPMISRQKLIAILVLGDKTRGRYTLEDTNIVEEVTARVAVSMEKEYLREQLREREEELSVINNCSAILSSSLDIQEIFGPFVEELRRVVDVSWASIVLLRDDQLGCAALSSSENSQYQVGDILPMEGTGAGWVITHRTTFLETDLNKDFSFGTGEKHRKSGLRTILYLPLIAKGRAIGCLIVASQQPRAYAQRHIKLFEQLAAQIAMPLENSQLYADAEKRARIDELTGLLNRRSLDEMLDDEISRHSRYGGNFSLAIIDLDRFKNYNDTYGHLSGDNLLREVGKYIRTTIRGADRAFRYGGDEFAIVLPHTDIEDAYQVAERVRNKIGDDLDTGSIPVSASIGLASWPKDGVSHTDIIDAADTALYKVKRSGRNRTGCTSSKDIVESTAEEKHDDNDNENKIGTIIHILAETVDATNHFATNHSIKVAEYAVSLGKTLQIDEEELNKLETSAMLADIGKMGINDTILNKSGELTEEERKIVQSHTQLGAAMVGNIPEIAHCRPAILYHHERYDGKGYPEGRAGEDIPLEARILSIACAYAAMTIERPYAEKMTPEQAQQELKNNAGTQFDPDLVTRFIKIQRRKAAITAAKNVQEVNPVQGR